MGGYILALMLVASPTQNINTTTTEIKYTKEQIKMIQNSTTDNSCATCAPYKGEDPNMK